jgi:hypothetical protein
MASAKTRTPASLTLVLERFALEVRQGYPFLLSLDNAEAGFSAFNRFRDNEQQGSPSGVGIVLRDDGTTRGPIALW